MAGTRYLCWWTNCTIRVGGCIERGKRWQVGIVLARFIAQRSRSSMMLRADGLLLIALADGDVPQIRQHPARVWRSKSQRKSASLTVCVAAALSFVCSRLGWSYLERGCRCCRELLISGRSGECPLQQLVSAT